MNQGLINIFITSSNVFFNIVIAGYSRRNPVLSNRASREVTTGLRLEYPRNDGFY